MTLPCFYCERDFRFSYGGERLVKTNDHIIPSSRGGGNNPCNKVICCSDCNNLKANHLPIELYEMLKSSKGVKLELISKVDVIRKNLLKADKIIRLNKLNMVRR